MFLTQIYLNIQLFLEILKIKLLRNIYIVEHHIFRKQI